MLSSFLDLLHLEIVDLDCCSMKKILVPTDFSDCAGDASDLAIKLAAASGAELIFLHLAIDHYPTSYSPGIPGDLVTYEVGQERYKLQQLVDKAEAAQVKSKYELILGNGQEEIKDYIKPFEIDWLVMGSHGATGIREKIIGSKTQHAIRHIDVPCIVIKHKQASLPKSIVYASSFKKDSPKMIHDVIEFTRLTKGTLHMLYLNFPDQQVEEEVAKSEMEKLMKRSITVPYTLNVIETNDQEFGVTQFAASIKADMIAVGMESKSVLGRLLNPVMAEQLINHSALPVLVLSQKLD